MVQSWKDTLEQLVVARGAALKRHAFLLCGDDAQSEDLVQEALVRAFGRPMRVPRTAAAEAYLRVTITNLFIDDARRRSRLGRVWPMLRRAEAVDDHADSVAQRHEILAALRALQPQQRACVVLRYYDDLPVAEVARVLGLKDGTVKRYLSEAMITLAARGRGESHAER